MKKSLILLTSLILLPSPILALTPSPRPEILSAQTTPSSIAQQITVKVHVGESRGSGTLINKEGNRYTLLTNAHVVSRGDSYRLVTSDGQEHTAKLLKTGKSFQGDDLAILEFTSKNNYTVAQWAAPNSLREGEKVYSAGFPIEQKDLNITTGEITLISPRPLQGGYQIGYSSTTQQGMSGGPLLNSQGKLIGIIGLSSLAVLNDAYQYNDGTKPALSTLEIMKRSSFAIPATIISQFTQQKTTPSTKPTIAKTPYTGIVKQIDDIAQQITVRIDSKNNGNGSGAIIAKEGDTYYVITAHHVIQNPDQYTVTTPDNQVYNLTPEQIITISKDNDLAVVKIKSSQNYQIAQIGSYIVENQWLFVSGFPGNDSSKQRKITAGFIQRKEENSFKTKDEYSLEGGKGLVYTNLSLKGMSGGPVLDLEGRLVGINTEAENQSILPLEGDYQEINYGYALGVPINTFLSLASRGSVPIAQLKIINTPTKEIQRKQAQEIIAQLFIFSEPSQGASAKEWLDYGNELWRSFEYTEAVQAFNRAIKLLEGQSASTDKEKLAIAYFGLGLALYNDYKYQAALEPFQKATTVDPRFVQAWRYQGTVLRALKQYPEALKALNKAIELNSKNFTLFVERGDVLRELPSLPESITSYTEAIKLKPDHVWAYNNRGLAYNNLKQYDRAIADYTQAVTVDSKFPLAYYNRGLAYYNLKQYDLAIADYNQALNLDFKFANAYNNRGLAYYDLKQYDKAIADYTQAFTIDPKYALAYYNRGLVYYDLKQYEKAIADYTQSISRDSKYVNAYYNRGLAYYNLNQYEKAIADNTQAISLDSKYVNAYYNRGLAYYNLKQYEKSIADNTQVISLDPKYVNAYYNRGLAYSALKQYEKSIADNTQAISLDSKYALAYSNRGLAYYDLKQYDLAIADYTQAISLDPKYANAYYNRGLAYYNLKQYDNAIADNTQAISLDPKYVNAYYNRGLAYSDLKQYEKSIADNTQAISLDPKYANAYNNRGLSYYDLKQYDKAILDFEKAAELYASQGNQEKAGQLQRLIQELRKSSKS